MRRLFHVLRRVEEAILATAMLAIAAITIVNVFARNVFGANLAAAEELNELLIVVVCFVGASYAAGLGRHIRMTAIVDALGPRTRKALLVVVSASTALLLFVFAWYAWSYARSVQRTSPVLGVPLGRVYLAAPIGLFLAGVQYVLAVAHNLTDSRAWVSYDRLDGYDEVDVPAQGAPPAAPAGGPAGGDAGRGPGPR